MISLRDVGLLTALLVSLKAAIDLFLKVSSFKKILRRHVITRRVEFPPYARAANAGRTAGGQGSMSNPPGLVLSFNPGYTTFTFLALFPRFS